MRRTWDVSIYLWHQIIRCWIHHQEAVIPISFVGMRLFLGMRTGFAGPSIHFYSLSQPRVAHLPAFGYGMHP